MTKIAIDVDETLYSFDDALRDEVFIIAEERDDKSILKLAYSNNQEWRNLVDHNQELAFEAIERVHEKTMTYRPFENAPDVVQKITDAGHEVLFATSRFQKHYEKTEDWLQTWFNLPPHQKDLVCIPPTESKKKHLVDCQYLIDDRPKTLIEFLHDEGWGNNTGLLFAREERKAFGLWRRYNQNLTEIPNLYLAPTWRGLEFYLKRKGVIE